MRRIAYVSIFLLGSLAGASLGTIVGDSSQPSGGHDPDPRAERRELDALAVEVARLRGVVDEGSKADSRSPDAGASDLDEGDFALIEAREREQSERRAATIAEAAAREAVDPHWASATERSIAEAFAIHAPPGSWLRSATCKTTLCILEIELPNGHASTGHLNWPAALELSRGLVVHHPPDPNGTHASVAYLARDGHSLPN